MSINRLEAPIISKNALIQIIMVLLPKKLGRESNLYDLGYEEAKRDIAVIISKHMGMNLASNPAEEILKGLRSGD